MGDKPPPAASLGKGPNASAPAPMSMHASHHIPLLFPGLAQAFPFNVEIRDAQALPELLCRAPWMGTAGEAPLCSTVQWLESRRLLMHLWWGSSCIATASDLAVKLQSIKRNLKRLSFLPLLPTRCSPSGSPLPDSISCCRTSWVRCVAVGTHQDPPGTSRVHSRGFF